MVPQKQRLLVDIAAEILADHATLGVAGYVILAAYASTPQ